MPSPVGGSSSPSPAGRHALVVAGGDIAPRAALDAAWPGWLDDVALVVAADSGWTRARALGLEPDLLVGDLDSLEPEVGEAAEAAGAVLIRSRVDKDESDTELAVLEAVRRGATTVTVVGAFGGMRLDHALANVWLLAHPALAGTGVALLDDRVRVTLLQAPDAAGGPATRLLPGPVGALVSLFPFGGGAEGITTRGLRYPLADEPLAAGPSRGLSNVRIDPDAAVTLRAGRLLVVEGLVADETPGVCSDA